MHRLIIGIIFTLFILTSCGIKEPLPEKKETSDTPSDTASVGESWFLVAEGEYLNLYHINDKKSLKNSELIDISVFPTSDIAELKKGIKFDTISDAYTVMEGFIN